MAVLFHMQVLRVGASPRLLCLCRASVVVIYLHRRPKHTADHVHASAPDHCQRAEELPRHCAGNLALGLGPWRRDGTGRQSLGRALGRPCEESAADV
jgi:hypothetical protein